MEKYTQTATIPKTAERCKAEGLGVTARQLRAWCKEGRLRHTSIGSKALIYWPNLIRFLEAGDTKKAEPPAPWGTVTPLSERIHK